MEELMAKLAEMTPEELREFAAKAEQIMSRKRRGSNDEY